MNIAELDEACVYWGKWLKENGLPVGIDGVALLQSIADVESSYGYNNVPRHEKSYDYGGRYWNRDQHRKWGAWSACSYGPFQVMWINIVDMGLQSNPIQAHADPSVSAEAAAKLILLRILPRIEKNLSIEDIVKKIGDGYNSGNPNDSIVPFDYCSKLWLNYQKRLSARKHV